MQARRRYCLTEVVGDADGAVPRSLELDEEERVIGRSENAALSVLVPTVSRRHAAVWSVDGVPYIRDLGSGHGTYVNSNRIADVTALRQGDLISLGQDLVFLVSAMEDAEIEALQDAALAREKPVDSSLVELALSEASEGKLQAYLDLDQAYATKALTIRDEQELLDEALRGLETVMSADRFIALLGDDAENAKTIARRLSDIENAGQWHAPSRGIVRRAMVGDKPIVTFDAQQDKRFRKRGSIAMSNVRSALAVGLNSGEQSLGVLYADNQVAAGLFSMPDGQAMQMVARVATMRILQLRAEKRAEELALKVEQLEAGKDATISGLATDIKSHLNRLELIADELEQGPEGQDGARLLRAEATRLRSDADRFIVFARRETTRPGTGDHHQAITPGMLADARQSSEVFDEPDDASGQEAAVEVPVADERRLKSRPTAEVETESAAPVKRSPTQPGQGPAEQRPDPEPSAAVVKGDSASPVEDADDAGDSADSSDAPQPSDQGSERGAEKKAASEKAPEALEDSAAAADAPDSKRSRR